MKPLETILLARSQPTERCDLDNAYTYLEYRLRPIAAEQWYELARQLESYGSYVDTATAIEQRRVDVVAGRTRAQQWRLWDMGRTPAETIQRLIGDTTFRRAASLHPLHAQYAAAHAS